MSHWRSKLTPRELSMLTGLRSNCTDQCRTPIDGIESLILKMADVLDADYAAQRLYEIRTGVTPRLDKDEP